MAEEEESEVQAPPDIRVETKPAATPEEVAAILLAYEALWPKEQTAAAVPQPSDWRFASRWWRDIGHRSQLPPRPKIQR